MTAPDTSNSQALLAALSDGLSGLVERAASSTVRVQARPGVAGTGIVWQPDGLILTADHVVQEEEMTVGLPDGRTFPAGLVGRDQRTDLALLRIHANGLPALPWAGSGAARPGTLVVAVGRPGGNGPIASMGVVSTTGPVGGGWRGSSNDEAVYSNVVLYPGFSGGPLLDARGSVVGMNTSTFGRGASVAIAGSTIQRVLGHLMATGRVRRGFLGITSQPVPLPERLAKGLGIDQDAAILVLAVEPGSPADQAGLMLGDALVDLGGQALRSMDDLQRALSPETVGQQATLRIIRGGRLSEVAVTVGERKAA